MMKKDIWAKRMFETFVRWLINSPLKAKEFDKGWTITFTNKKSKTKR